MLNDLQKKVLDHIDKDQVVRFAMEFTDCYSPTGLEAEAARFCFEEYSKIGLRTKLQEVQENRFNVIGELAGTGGGLSLMFNGHLDISYTEKEVHYPGGENSFDYAKDRAIDHLREKSSFQEGWICGNGIRNMKSAMAAYVGAVSAIMRAGVKLKGDILIAAVCGEIEKSPVDDFRGPMYRGYGEGTRFLITRGGVVDGCILGEPTKLQLVRGNFGTVWIKLHTKGELSHTAWSDQVYNCIGGMAGLLTELKNWSDEYSERNEYLGTRPLVNISAIQGGWPWRLSRTPSYCNLYLDVRYIPGIHPLEIKEEIRKVITKAKKKEPKLDVKEELLITIPPAETPDDDPVIQIVKTAHKQIFGQDPEESFKGTYTDASHLTSYGIPTVTYGPAGRNKPGVPDYVYGWQSVEDLINTTKVYTLAALDFCMRERIP